MIQQYVCQFILSFLRCRPSCIPRAAIRYGKGYSRVVDLVDMATTPKASTSILGAKRRRHLAMCWVQGKRHAVKIHVYRYFY